MVDWVAKVRGSQDRFIKKKKEGSDRSIMLCDEYIDSTGQGDMRSILILPLHLSLSISLSHLYIMSRPCTYSRARVICEA